MAKKVLFVTTSHRKLGNTGRDTGIWAEEVVVPYYAFTEAGYAVDIASPRGGAAPIDPGSLQPKGKNPAPVERFLADASAQAKLEATLTTDSVAVDGYDAIYFPGGHGAMWDLPNDDAVRRLVEAAHLTGKVIAAVCHGVAALVSARTTSGAPIVAQRRVNSFTDAEEDAAGLSEVVPFKLETRLRELGGQFENAPNWASFAVRDGSLVTGQNPASSARVAQLVLETLAATTARAD